jgi:hypothetical protein
MGIYNMKKKTIGIFLCLMMMAAIPAAAGLCVETEQPDEGQTGVLDKTIIRGIVLFPRSSVGGKFSFFALRIHYTTIGIGGLTSGTLKLRRINLPTNPHGYVGKCFVYLTFRGNLDNYI